MGAAVGRAKIARAPISKRFEISARAFCVWEDRTMTGRTERLRSELGTELEELVAACSHGDERAWQRLLGAVCRMAMDLARGS